MRRLLPLVLLAAAIAAAPSAAADPAVLDQPRNGADAVRALGDSIATVAREHQTTAAELRERLQSDLSLWVDVQGRLFYVDPPAPTDATEPTTTTTTAAGGTVPALSSRKGAGRTIYLDFDGHGGDYGAIGGAWDLAKYTGDGIAEPYSLDAALGFSATDEADMRSIWERVAEDFAPFDVNVTTVDPGLEAIDRTDANDMAYGTRVVMTSSSNTCTCGGVAYVGVFDHFGTTTPHAYYQPAFVYNKSAKYAAEAASHEAGHNLGLNHDGTRRVGYYEGHGSWSPIMGVGYYTPLSQWSRGEYSGANNTQDDFVVAAGNGAPIRDDDHGTGSGASPLATSAAGVIHNRSDVDDFTFTLTNPAAVSLRAEPAPVSPNLDIHLTLRDSSGTVIAVDDPASGLVSEDLASGLGAGISRNLGAGTYRISIDGIGALDPLTSGYSDYGSVGSYTVTVVSEVSTTGGGGSGDTTTTDAVPAMPTGVTATASGPEVAIAWTSSGTVTGGEVQRLKDGKNGLSLVATLPFPGDLKSFTDTPGTGTFAYRVRLSNGAGWSELSAESATVTPTKTTGGKPQRTQRIATA